MTITASEAWPITWLNEGGLDAWPAPIGQAAITTATAWLRGLSGGVYGVCTYNEDYRGPYGDACFPTPYKDEAGGWQNVVGAPHDCCGIRLAHVPVRTVAQVTLAGSILDPASYGVERGLLRRYGACWPTSAECSPPRVTVVYDAGRQPDAAAAVALGVLAAEVAKDMNGDECRLPDNVLSVIRQGVTYQMIDPTVLAQNRRTGITIVDNWVDTVNPLRRRQRPVVASPDVAARVR